MQSINAISSLFFFYSTTFFDFLDGVCSLNSHARGGIEDRTAIPRTDSLEAKDRNARSQGQGPTTQPQVFSKKRFSKKFFRQSPIHRRSQNFWLGGRAQATNHMQWKSHQKFSKKELFLWDKDIVGWKIWNRCLLALNQDFAKKEGLN